MINSDYTVFIDESFYKWFGLPTQESNLCYGALSLPTERMDDLIRFEGALRQFTYDHLPLAEQSKCTPCEIKHSQLRHLSHDVIDILGKKLACFLTKNNAWVFGFFVPAEGFMNYKLRSDFIDDVHALKGLPQADYKARIAMIRGGMLKEWKDAERDVGLLTECYKTFFGFIAQFHGRDLKKSYRIVYDSRNPQEDEILHNDALELLQLVERVKPGPLARYRGYETAASSKSPGLRVADWIAGEVRGFFYRSPSILQGNSTFDILSPYGNPDMTLIDGTAPFYRKPLPAHMIESLQTTGVGFMLPQIRDRFAAGLITYYAQQGEARHISIPELAIYDMAD